VAVFTLLFWVATSFSGLNAQTIYYVKADGTGNGSSWANAAGSIQDMIDMAEAGDKVWVAAGDYYPTHKTDATDERSKTFLLKEGVHLYGGFAGNETSIDDRTRSDAAWDSNGKTEPWEFANISCLAGNIDGIADYWTKIAFNINYANSWRYIVSGNGGNAKTVVTCSNGTILDGFYIICGSERGVYTSSGRIQNCSVAYNTGYGIVNPAGVVTDSEICITDGIGINNNNGTVSNCIVYSNANYAAPAAGNIFYNVFGGGILNFGEGEIINCTVTDNQLIMDFIPSQAPLSGINAYGGGICNYSNGKIDKCLVMNNTIHCYNGRSSGGSGYNANAFGGGIYNSGGVISNSCVFNNRATAVSYYTGNYFSPVYSDSYGGIYNRTNGVTYNTTVVNNYRYSNTGSDHGFANYYGGKSYNCITSVANINQNFVRPTSFTGTVSSGQQLEELLQADWRLNTGSTYINAGSLDNLPEWLINGTDLAGNPRTSNGKISMGAYEYATYTSLPAAKSNAGITLYSSPVADFVTVSGLQPGETVRMYNIHGQQLFNFQAVGETEQITVGHWPAGVYILKTGSGKALKWVKE